MFFLLRRESSWIPAILLVIMVGCWIELDLYAPSFPQMMHYFATNEQMMQWTLSLNFLGFFLASLLCGPLADSFGRRNVILVGSVIFVLGSLICLAASSIGWMLCGRLIQGVGVSAPVTVCMAVIADIYQGERQVRLLSKMNSAITISMALAPIAGVYLTEAIGWHANFVAIFVIALLGVFLILLFIPETHQVNMRVPFAPKALIMGYWTLLKSRAFMAAVLGLCFSVTPYFVLIGILPLLLMEQLGIPINQYAFYQGSIVGLFSALSLSLPWMLKRFDLNKLVCYSTILSMGALFASFVMSLIFADSPLAITALMWIYVIGIVGPSTIMFSGAMDMFPELRASASSLIQAMRMLSMALGTALAGALYNGTFASISIVLVLFMTLSIPAITMAFRKRGGVSMAPEVVQVVH